MAEIDRYELGYANGESSMEADWDHALDGLLPDGVEPYPRQVAAYLSALQDAARMVLAEHWHCPVAPLEPLRQALDAYLATRKDAP